MPRFTHLLTLPALTLSLASCYVAEDPRPFAGRGRSLDQPPRYGDGNRYVEPVAPGPDRPMGSEAPMPPVVDPTGPALDPGLTLSPQTPSVPGGGMTPPSVTPPVTVTTPQVTPPGSEVPFARAVPGKPGFVYSPKDPKKIISVEGLRSGQKARDPETGDIFRVPY